MEPIDFSLISKKNKLELRIKNSSAVDMLVNKKFSLGPAGKRGNIELSFIDNKGVVHELSAKINYSKGTDSDLIVLSPNESIEKEIDHNELIRYYNLDSGHYTVKGIYKNSFGEDKGAYMGKINSSPITIEIKHNDFFK